MAILDFLRRNKKFLINLPVAPSEPEKSIAELMKDYRSYRMCVSMAPSTDKKFWENNVRQTEDKIIAKLPGEFQRTIFRILQRYRFDFCEFLEREDWAAPFKGAARDICHFLHYGSPYPTKPKWPPLPFSGESFFLYLLGKAKESGKTDSLCRVEVVLSALKIAVEARELMGNSFAIEDLQNIGMLAIVVFAGEFRRQALALMDIFCEVDGGERFVQEIIMQSTRE